MKTKSFLEQIYLSALKVESRLERITCLQSMAGGTTAVMKTCPGCGQSSSSRIENAVVSIQFQFDLLADEINDFLETRQKVLETIKQLETETEQIVLELRYLCRYSWRTIAKMMSLSRERVYSIHRNALNNIAKKIDTRDCGLITF